MKKIFILLLLSSCSYKFPTNRPTAKQPGARSAATSLVYNQDMNSFLIYKFDGYSDSKVIGYKLKDDTVNADFFQNQMQGQVPFGYHRHEIYYPGAVWVSIDKLIDEIEITNIHWGEFLHYLKRDSTESVYRQMLPDKTKLPGEDYFTNPYFRFYPVVGITYEQAETYCKWRTEIVNGINKSLLRSKGITPSDAFSIEFRLPTEKEWETYAACGNNLKKYPQGTKYVDTEIHVNPKAANYLKIKNGLNQSVAQIKKDIKESNREKQKIIVFNIDRPNAPYFISNKTPFYAYDFPVNNYGLYNMIGNVSELVKEKGITKGGSYLDKLEDCAIEKKGKYIGASPTVGFRAVCEIKYR
jgi:formylglycine-generating enzyme required for sulfatase activity